MTKHEIYKGPNLSSLSREERERLVKGANQGSRVAGSQMVNKRKPIHEWPPSKPTTLAEQLANQS